jgi:hypothetical protein
MRISEHFQLKKSQLELDFVDIDIIGDLPLFLDPHYISFQKSKLAIDASYCIQTFFDKLLLLLRNHNRENANQHLEYIGEINEVHLGFSQGASMGRGIGSLNSSDLIKSINESNAIHTGLIEKLEDSRIFIKGIGSDKISDLCANVIKKVLLEYTKNQCILWNIPLTTSTSGYYWDPDIRGWIADTQTERLVINGKPYLLVPKEIVTFKSEYTPEKYMQHFVLNFLQTHHLRINSNLVQVTRNKEGEIVNRFVTKKSIKEDLANKNIIPDKEWLLTFTLENREVLERFKREAKIQGDLFNGVEVTPNEIDTLIEALKYNLISIPEGNESFKEYENAIKGITELLFYPDLNNPQVQREINEGRKRIDIVFTNIAQKRIFNIIRNTFDIPSNYIFIECKNYTKDIANPELDQMIGRFSNNNGKVGIIFCRHLDNPNLFLSRCKDTYRTHQSIILHITDDVLINMLDNYKLRYEGSYHDIITRMVDEVRLS